MPYLLDKYPCTSIILGNEMFYERANIHIMRDIVR